jgi:hypothetical protein
MNTRKLIPLKYLSRYSESRNLGVPLRRIIRDNNLKISGPHLAKLIDWHDNLLLDNDIVPIKAKTMIRDSLFPTWLKDYPNVQEQPSDYAYLGKFPLGGWEIRI